jgi:hypothetical protein
MVSSWCSLWGRVGDPRQRPKLLLVLRGWLRGFESGGRDSSVGLATRCGLDSPGIESRWGRDFPNPSRPALGPTQPPIQWVPGFFPGVKLPVFGVE